MLFSEMANRILLLTAEADEEFKIPFLEGVVNYFVSGKFIRTLVVLAVGLIIWFVLKMISKKRLINVKKGSNIEKNAHFVLSFARAILVFCLLIVVLQVNGVNVTSLVAGLGVASVIVGFAFQDLLADWIKGISIAADRFFSVGDVIETGNVTGRVVKISLKVTQIEDIYTGSIITMDNRLLSEAMVLSNNLNLYAPIPYDMKPEAIEKFLSEVTEEIRKVDGVKMCENKGLQRFDDSKLTYFMRAVIDDPFKKLSITRAANDIILKKYDEWGMAVPYNQLDVHIKDR